MILNWTVTKNKTEFISKSETSQMCKCAHRWRYGKAADIFASGYLQSPRIHLVDYAEQMRLGLSSG